MSIISCVQHNNTDDTYPERDSLTRENMILLEFATKKLLYKDHFHQIHRQATTFSRTYGMTSTYAVIPVHCGPLADAMLEAVQKEGSVGWQRFWQGLKKPAINIWDAEDTLVQKTPK